MDTFNIASGMLAEFEHEIATTKKFLERIPEDKLDWRPHEKSLTAGQLGFHIASLMKGVLSMALLDQPSLPDVSSPALPKSKQEILSALEESKEFVFKNLPAIKDESMHKPVKLMKGDKVLLEVPRVAFIRSIFFNHCYHHRGQLGVYLRLLGAVVPSSYGPSGDESF